MNDLEADPPSSRIHDMPSDRRPREKLAALGPTALDNAELMALFICTGQKGRSAIDIGRELIAKYGSMGALGGLPVAELCKEKGLGPAKASKLAAAFELGARVAREQVREIPLDTPELIHDFFGPQLRHLAQEQVVVATLDARLRHRNRQTGMAPSRGIVTRNLCNGGTRCATVAFARDAKDQFLLAQAHTAVD